MKFRPQVQLRFRSEEHYETVKALAAKAELSLNEYVLVKIDAGHSVAAPTENEKATKKGHKCPHCGAREVKPWGVGMRCENCKRNF